MLVDAIRDVQAICNAELRPDAARQLLLCARTRAADRGHATNQQAGVDDELWRGVDALNVWQQVWFQLAQTRPELFPHVNGAANGYEPERDSAWELALRYALRAGELLPALRLTRSEAAQLRAARRALYDETGVLGLRLPRKTVVVGPECPALNHAMAGAAAQRAPDLAEYILVHADTVEWCRSRESDQHELAFCVLHEELHVALAEACGNLPMDGAETLACMAEEAAVSCIELAAQCWTRSGHMPSLVELMERAQHHSYSKAARGLLRAFPATDAPLVEILTRLALAVVGDGTDVGATAALDGVLGAHRSRSAWLRALPMP